MKHSEYQKLAHTTAIYPKPVAYDYLCNGLISEVGEMAGVLKKYLRGDFAQVEFEKRLQSEFGDVLWYIAEMDTFKGNQWRNDVKIPDWPFNATIIDVSRSCTSFLSGITPWNDLAGVILSLCKKDQGFVNTAMEQNISKLSERKSQGTIKGDGERRG